MMLDHLTPPYATILADPPWAYERRTPPWRSTSTATYSLMPTNDIKALPVPQIATADAHLYLWAVLPMMSAAYEVVDAWGFRPETVVTWCKPGAGLGGGWRGNTEHLIVGRKGLVWENPTCADCGGRARGARKCPCRDPQWRHKGVPCEPPARPFAGTAGGTWWEAPRGEHSVKPALFSDLIESMSPGPYVELFARQPRLGWDSWGWGWERTMTATT